MYSLREFPNNCPEQLICSAFYTKKGRDFFPPRYTAVPATYRLIYKNTRSTTGSNINTTLIQYNNNMSGYNINTH